MGGLVFGGSIWLTAFAGLPATEPQDQGVPAVDDPAGDAWRADFDALRAEHNEAKRDTVLRVMSTCAPDLVTDDGTMVSDWQETMATAAPVTWRLPDSKRAIMEVVRVETISFADDTGRYDVVLDPDGAIVLDVGGGFASDTAAFTVGPVPVVVDREGVHVVALGELAARSGRTGLLDLEPQEFTAEAVSLAFEHYDGAAVYIDEGRAVAVFFAGAEVGEVYLFAPDLVFDGEPLAGALRNMPPELAKRKAAVCDVLYNKCVDDQDVDACGHWLDHCLGD